MHEKAYDDLSSVGGLAATRSPPKLLSQGKPRTLGGGGRPWRVRLYADGAERNRSGELLGERASGSKPC
jgi:hypothetical protein